MSELPSPYSTRVEKEFVVPRIQQLLSAGFQTKFTLLCAPSGYGKTSALRSLMKTFTGQTKWLHLTEKHNNPDNLCRSIFELFPAEDHMVTIHSFSTFFRNIENSADEICLVLDGYQHIQSNIIHNAIQSLISDLPPNIHIFLATRSDPPLALSKLRLSDDIVELTNTHLALTESETIDFLRFRNDTKQNLEVVHKIWQQCEGWPALICLLAQSSLNGIINSDVKAYKLSIFRYFDEEIFMQQTSIQREFMLKTSILECLSPQICEAVLEQSDIHAQFNKLIRDHLLISVNGDIYRYHFMLAEFLKYKLVEKTPGLIPIIHLQAARWYERHGVPCQAIEHYLEAGDKQNALDGILQLGWDTLQRGEFANLLKWCDRLENLACRPVQELAELKGFAFLQQGNVDQAEKVMNELSSVRGVLASAMIARFHGHYSAVEQVVTKAIRQNPFMDEVLRCQIELQLGLARLYDRKVKDAERVLNKALYRAEKSGHLHLILANTIALSVVYHNRGEYNHSITMLERSLTIAGKELTPETISTQFRLSQLLLETGRINQARIKLENSLQIGTGVVSAEILAYAYIIAARIARLELNLNRAAEYHQVAARLAPKGGLMRRANLTERMLLYLASGDTAVVKGWASEEGLIAENAEYTGDECYLVFARLLLHLDQPSAAIEVLEKLIHHARKNNWVNAIQLSLPWLALSKNRAGDIEYANQLFCEAIQIALPNGYVLSFLEAYQEAPGIIQKMLLMAEKRGNNIQILRELLGENQIPTQLELPISIEKQSETQKDCFEVRLFGGLRVFRDGIELAEKGWRTERARDLLAYFAVHYENPVPMETIMEHLWPDRPLKETKRLFHTNLYYLRRALLPSGDDLELFVHRSGSYKINLRYFWIDLKEFNDLVGSESDGTCLNAALHLAKDRLLIGFYDDWAVNTQHFYDQRLFTLKSRLAQLYCESGAIEDAILCAENALQMEPLNEMLARQIMKWHCKMGNRAAAVSCFKTLQQNLAEELSIEPSSDTIELVEKLLR